MRHRDWLGNITGMLGLGALASIGLWWILNYFFPDAQAILYLGVFLQVVISIFVAFALNRWWLSPRLSKWSDEKNRIVQELSTSLTEREGWPVEEIIGLAIGVPEGAALKTDIQRLLAPEEIEKSPSQLSWWFEVSKLLVKIGMLCRKKSEPRLENIVKSRYDKVRQLLRLDLKIKFVGKFVYVLIFLLTFLFFNKLTVLFSNELAGSHYSQWCRPIAVLAGSALLALFGHYILQFAVRWITERTWTDLDDIIASALTGPLCAASIATGISQAIRSPAIRQLTAYLSSAKSSTDFDPEPFFNAFDKVIFIIITTWVIIYIFNYVVIYLLTKWAERTEQKYDDLFVRILQVFGTFIIIALAFAFLLVQEEFKVRHVDNVLLPYSIFLSVFTAIIGYASIEMFGNFFNGIMLQIDKPFQRGDRLLLETGELCDVRDIGMRSTTLYNVNENSEVSIPNKIFANQKITNVSRPNLAYRMDIPVYVVDKAETIQDAEMHLLDVAYCYAETDRARFAEETTEEHIKWGHVPFDEEFKKLARMHPKIQDVRVRRINEFVSPYEQVTRTLRELKRLRWRIRKLRPGLGEESKAKDTNRRDRIKELAKHTDEFRILCERIFAMADYYPDIRPDMDGLFGELYREPAVRMFIRKEEEGGTYAELLLTVFATHAQRSREVAHRLSTDIQRRFQEEDLKLVRPQEDSRKKNKEVSIC